MRKASSTTNLIACVAIVGAITVGFITGPAFAQTGRDDTEFMFKFAYKPSELQSAPAAEKLLARLENEVRDHCNHTRRMTMGEHILTRKCVDTTVQATIAKFASATVAQAYDYRTGC